MIRVLHIFHEMANGGVEQFVMNYYRHIDREVLQFDFLVSTESEIMFEKEIKELGGRIYYAYSPQKNMVKHFNDISNIVRKNQYQIIHRHTGSAFGYFDLHAAKAGGAGNLILHAHNSSAGNVWLHNLSKKNLENKL